jgi:flavin reductase (DIM6/NTAB) family NADH-FMN oxidoreductase RutF
MINLDAADISPELSYKLLTGTVTPRPIAWVSTLNASGGVNLAPFSCYTYIASDPPLVAIAIGARYGFKDTLSNARQAGEFTINTVHDELVRPVAETSRKYPADMSEAADLDIALEPGLKVKVPRVKAALISLECTVYRVVEVGDSHHHSLLMGRVVCFRIVEKVWAGDRIDMTAFRAVGRLGGPLYVRPGEIERVEPTKDERLISRP